MELYSMSLWQLMVAGGWLMWPILLCSVVSLAIIFEKFIFLSRCRINAEEFMRKILEKLKRSDTKEALNICDSAKVPLSNIIKAGVLKYDRPRQQISEALEDAALYEVPRLERNLAILSTISQLTPLLGLLGTAAGMIKCFQIMQVRLSAQAAVSPGDLAGGIWQALLTTVFGLAVAIPSFVAYNYFVQRVNSFVLEMEKASMELVNFLAE